jgi:ClpP class serine protease
MTPLLLARAYAVAAVPDLSSIIFLLIFVAFLVPMITQRMLATRRYRAIRKLEQARGSRVITLIHRQESISLLGIPLRRFIDVEDSEAVLRAVRLTPDTVPIDLVAHTPGGLVLASEQIARALHRHPAKVTVLVPHYAMSGGTLLALAADEIVMDENAVLGPVDPQLGEYPAVSILNAIKLKDKNEVDDRTLILADIAQKAVKQMQESVFDILRDNMEEEKARDIATKLTSGEWTHDYPITCEKGKELGLPISCDMPMEVLQLMDFFPQAKGRRPSVQYIPLPYGIPEKGKKS